MTINETKDVRILNIDAWADGDEGCWTWNNWFEVGTLPALEFAALREDRDLINWLIDNMYLKEGAADKVYVDDDGYNYVINDVETNEPLFAFEYGSIFN
jgi:hypothetical protein